jgi:hypothetical protein
MTVLPPELPPELTIDDLSFADLLRVARDDIPGASGGRWTLHGAVDPGMTLLEVMAYLYEQRLYAADQTTDDVTRAGLRLLGIQGPSATRAATTVLAVTGGAVPSILPAGTVFALVDDEAGRRFSVTDDISVLPVHGVRVEGSPVDRGDTLDLVLDRDGPLITGHTLSLLVQVRTDPGIRPEWDLEAVDVPPPVTLAWRAVGADGSSEPVSPGDGTGGLRRSGLLRLPWPAVWNRVGGGGCRLRATVTDGRFTEAPRAGPVVPNAVAARHLTSGATDLTDQLTALLPVPAQRLHLPADARGSVDDSPGSVRLVLTDDDGSDETWHSVADWVGVGPEDRVMLVDRENGDLLFGDGLAGRIPSPQPGGRAEATYSLGGGPAGNLGFGRRWREESGGHGATNPVPATGGADAETTDQARQRAADSLAVTDRTVTRDDAVRLTLDTPGVAVARASAWLGHHPAFPCATLPGAVTVVVVPAADRSGPPESWVPTPTPDPGLVAAVRARLEAARLLGHEVFVVGPTYRAVRVEVRLSGSADATVEQRVIEALARHLDPLRGGSEEEGWPFAGTLRPSGLIGVAAEAAGAEVTVSGLTIAVDDGPATDCADVPLGPADLPWLADHRIVLTAALPTGGGLS